MLELNKIYCGGCQDVMHDINNDSVDCIVTDPPYGMSFMGKNWDKAVPSIAIWQECLRVLKPGAFAFVMCIPRQDCLARMICRLEDAGFNVAFSSIYWTYASGFPKAQNLSKAADKRNDKPQRSIELEEYLTKEIYKNYKTHTILATEMGIAESLIRHWIGKCGNQFLIPPLSHYNILKQKLNLNNNGDKLITWEEAKREVIGKKRKARAKGQKSALPTLGAKTEYIDIDITNSATPQAKALDGAYGGFQPKPAVEIVIVAMRPLEEKTYIDQALKNGHGCTWLDDARIPFTHGETPETVTKKPSILKKNAIGHVRQDEPLYGGTGHSKGRFPANVLCEDDVLSNGNITKSTGGTGVREKTEVFKGTEGREHFNYGDIGSYSRYFSLDAWFAERIKHLPKEAQKTFPWLIVPKASKSEKNRGCEELEGLLHFPSNNESGNMLSSGDNKPRKIKGNFHPTTKPLKLMSWLIILASREGGIVLDPFCGSGTTAIAAMMQGRRYIGIEREEEYCEIARKRLGAIPQRLDSCNGL